MWGSTHTAGQKSEPLPQRGQPEKQYSQYLIYTTYCSFKRFLQIFLTKPFG